jgi:hypothetical protein
MMKDLRSATARWISLVILAQNRENVFKNMLIMVGRHNARNTISSALRRWNSKLDKVVFYSSSEEHTLLVCLFCQVSSIKKLIARLVSRNVDRIVRDTMIWVWGVWVGMNRISAATTRLKRLTCRFVKQTIDADNSIYYYPAIHAHV